MTRSFRHLEKRDPAPRQARFQARRVAPMLFGDEARVPEGGRIGYPGTVWAVRFDTLEQAQVVLASWEARKRKRGYTWIDGDR